MAENMFSSDGSTQSGDAFSSVTQIPTMEHTGNEPIQAQSQSHSLVQSTGRLKRDKTLAYATLSADEKGRETFTCKFCQSVIPVDKKVNSEVCFTILEEEEEEEEIPLRNVKARTDKGPLADINEDYLTQRDKELLKAAREALKELLQTLKQVKPISGPESK